MRVVVVLALFLIMSKGPREVHPSLRHPLMGGRLSTLLYAFAQNKGVSLRYTPLAAAMLGFAALRAPLGLLERIITLKRQRNRPKMRDPVFIIGHWRSGTTHLHNLLSHSPLFGHISPLASGLPNELLTLATWFRPWLEQALPEDRYVDKVAVTPDSPQEDEIPLANQQSLSVFHAVYFPRKFHHNFERGVFLDGVEPGEIERWARFMRAFLEKVALHQNRDCILVKNPVYTARIAQLHALFPNARFIHIRRNPYNVYASTLLYYQRLLEELALQSYDHVDLPRFVEETYVKMMTRYDRESAQLPSHLLTEVSFEELEDTPLKVLESIHKNLGLAHWAETQDRVRVYLSKITGYQKNKLQLNAEQIARVKQNWGEYVTRWSYSPS